MNTQIFTDDTIACQGDFYSPLTDDEFQHLIDAIEADRRLRSAEYLIAINLAKMSRERGYADASTNQLAFIGRITTRSAVMVKQRLVERGYFRVDQGIGFQHSNRYYPQKVPIRSRL